MPRHVSFFLLALALFVACGISSSSAAKVRDMDGCGLVSCPPALKGINNVIPNPHGACSFCCCAGTAPKIAHCPGGRAYDHASRNCVRSTEC